jgi:pyruvate carboxylase
MDKRPGLYLDPIDFDKVRKDLKTKYNTSSETDVAS